MLMEERGGGSCRRNGVFHTNNLKLGRYSNNKINEGKKKLFFSFPDISGRSGAAAPSVPLKYVPEYNIVIVDSNKVMNVGYFILILCINNYLQSTHFFSHKLFIR